MIKTDILYHTDLKLPAFVPFHTMFQLYSKRKSPLNFVTFKNAFDLLQSKIQLCSKGLNNRRMALQNFSYGDLAGEATY